MESVRMKRPTMITVAFPDHIVIEVSDSDRKQELIELGFRSREEGRPYTLKPADETRGYRMLEALRDLDIPFATHRTGGADYAVKTFRDKRLVSGIFKRINFFDNDNDEDAPFVIEDF